MLDIRVATTPEELHAIYRLRYQVYVEEIGAEMEYADHQAKKLCEPWDASGENIGAWLEGQLVGCVRFNSAATTDFSDYEHLFHLPALKRFIACSPEDFSYASKLAVIGCQGGKGIGKQLLRALYDLMRIQGITLNFMICQLKMINVYRRFGWQLCGVSFIHPEGGSEVPMVLVLQDQAHLQRVQSPFLPLCEQYPNDQERATQLSQFYASVAESGAYPSAQSFGRRHQEFKLQLAAGLKTQPEA